MREPPKGRNLAHDASQRLDMLRAFFAGRAPAIIEIVDGMTYPDFVREHLFKPAGLPGAP
jgi:hypothetical protein